MEYKELEKINWISIDKEIKVTPYSAPKGNPKVKGQLVFQTSHDLEVTVHLTDKIYFINLIAYAGGCLFSLIFVVSLFFKLWVRWLMHLTIVRNLFKIDPSRDKKPRSVIAMRRKDPKVLLAEARAVSKKRVAMTRNACDRTVIVFEAVIGVIFCKATKFARVLSQGRKEIEQDLNVYNIM